MRKLANWDDYRYFVSLVQTGSVRAAAGLLGVNPSTVTRRLDALEARLGQKLFVRSQAGLRTTRDGEELMAELAPLAARLGDLEAQLGELGEEVAGRVRITMPDVFAVTLMEAFGDYTHCHPRVRLEFLPAYRALDLARGEADMAIRITDQPPDSLIGRRLGRYRLMAYASRAYLEDRDPLGSPEKLVWIESGLESIRAPGFKARYFPSMPYGVRCNNVLLQQAAVRAGMGITLLPCALGDADEDLCRVGDAAPMDGQDIWLLFHPDLRGVARIQSVSTHIQAAFADLAPRLLGSEDPA